MPAAEEKTRFDDREAFSGGNDLDLRLIAQAVIDRSADTIFWLDSRARIVYANKAAADSLGYSPSELLTMSIHEIDRDFPPAAWPPHLEELKRRGSIRFESRHWTKDGRILPMEVTCNYFEREGHFYSFAFNRDISVRKRVEAELEKYREGLEELVRRRTAELQQAIERLTQSEKLAALGNLVAGVAHELNTPLGNARTMAGALGEAVHSFVGAVEVGNVRKSQLDSFVRKSLEATDLIESNTARAAELIEQFKQVAVDQTSMRRREFRLYEMIEDLLGTLQPLLKHSPVRLEHRVPADISMDSYPGPLGQVLVNLVSNALMHGFADGGAGVISIEAEELSGGLVRLTCADTGPGVPEGIRTRIFEPFFTTRLGKGGSGLGLYIVHNLVTGALGGTIELSPSGGGARFVITLPKAGPKVGSESPGAQSRK